MNTENIQTPIQKLGNDKSNTLYIKREDMLPYSFGGNKARKALLFFEEIDRGDYTDVVTYGSSSSNHVRVVANLSAARGMNCHIISPKEASEPTFNSALRELLGAKAVTVPVEEVHDTIEAKLKEIKDRGGRPYFIPGGGHGNIGTQAYVECFEEIKQYETDNNIKFDYIFFASGTGTTHAGLAIGKMLYEDPVKIIGISIARPNPRGRNVVLESVKDYLNDIQNMKLPGNMHSPDRLPSIETIEEAVIFEDKYIGEGYARETSVDIIREVFIKYGIPLDSTYTGKAYNGMCEYIKEHGIKDRNILFIHTGGTPLFFDTLGKL